MNIHFDLGSVVIAASVTAGVSFLGVILTLLMNARSQRRIAELTTQLQTFKHERDTMFSALHKERSDAIKQLNAKIWEYRIFLDLFKTRVFGESSDAKEMNDENIPKYLEIIHLYAYNRIYFNDHTSQLIEACTSAHQELGNEISNHFLFARHSPDTAREHIRTIQDGYSNRTWQVFLELQSEFRRLLGVAELN